MIKQILVSSAVLVLGACAGGSGIGQGPIQLGPQAQAVFEGYQESRYPMAFAVTTDGQYGFYFHCEGASCGTISTSEVNNRCKATYQRPCAIYAKGNVVVWDFDAVQPAAGKK